jgi:hypothetical protein
MGHETGWFGLGDASEKVFWSVRAQPCVSALDLVERGARRKAKLESADVSDVGLGPNVIEHVELRDFLKFAPQGLAD